MEKCLALFKLDYNTIEIGNPSGELSSHYPHQIIIPENEKVRPASNAFASGLQSTNASSNGCSTMPPGAGIGSVGSSCGSTTSNGSGNGANASAGLIPNNGMAGQRAPHQQETIYENSYDPRKLRDLMCKARLARSRTRFPVPVILYKGKFVCRSSTLSSGPEMYTRSGIDYLFSSSTPTESDDVDLCRQGEWRESDCERSFLNTTHNVVNIYSVFIALAGVIECSVARFLRQCSC